MLRTYLDFEIRISEFDETSYTINVHHLCTINDEGSKLAFVATFSPTGGNVATKLPQAINHLEIATV